MKINYTIFVLALFGVLQSSMAQEIEMPVIYWHGTYEMQAAEDSNMALINLKEYIPGIHTDVRYATTNNFTHQKLYPYPAVYLRRPAAKALRAVQQELKKQGLGLLIFDAYRPYSVTKKMWEIVPDERYAANPKNGSGHNRGIAVDLTLYDLKTGKALTMPTDFDDFTEKAHQNYPVKDSAIAAHRALLRTTMERHGFVNLTTEWWHFYLKSSQEYLLMDIPFDSIK